MNGENMNSSITIQTQSEYMATLGPKGQVTIPAELRRRLGIQPNDKLLLRLRENKVEIESGIMTLEEVMGSVKPLDPAKSFKHQRNEAIEEHVEKVIHKMKQ